MVYHDIVDLAHLTWTLSRNSSGTAGSFLKSYEQTDGVKYYYKLSNFDTVRGIYGHECINEIVAPVFDNGLSLLFSCYDDGAAMAAFDRLKDGPVNNFVGNISLAENLKKVPKKMISTVKNLDLREDVIFNGMKNLRHHETPGVPLQYWDCIRDMIAERRDNIAKIFD